jgi:hypothetical protein
MYGCLDIPISPTQAIKKQFRGDKSYLGNRSLRVSGNESADARIFIEFVALIVRCKLCTRLKSMMAEMSKKPNYMTVPAALKELEKIEMIRHMDNIYRLDHAVTATQKIILKAFGVDENYIQARSERLSAQLKVAEMKEKMARMTNTVSIESKIIKAKENYEKAKMKYDAAAKAESASTK